MQYLDLGNGQKAIVDDEDYAIVNQWNWYLGAGYVVRNTPMVNGGKRGHFWLHRLIMKCPRNKRVDHVNSNTLDNRKANLRICTSQQNSFNQKVQNRIKTSRYKGVYRRSKGEWTAWVAQIHYKRKHYYIGAFQTEHLAALAYDLWAIELFGEFARTNCSVVLHR